MAGFPITRITSEAEAFEVLQRLVESSESEEGLLIQFEQWPKLELTFTGPQFNRTITTGVMKSLLEVQKSVNSSYALAVYGEANTHKLTEDERKQLELVVQVNDGSSKYSSEYWDLLNKTIVMVVDKMDPQTLAITVIGLALAWSAQSVWKKHIISKKEQRMAELANDRDKEQLAGLAALSSEETRRLEIFERAVQQSRIVGQFEEISEEGQDAVLKAAREAETATIQGMEVSGAEATQLAKVARRRAVERTVVGEYYVRMLSSEPRDVHRLLLTPVDANQQEIAALVNDHEIDQALREALKQAVWDRSSLRLSLEVRMLGDEITRAFVSSLVEPDVA